MADVGEVRELCSGRAPAEAEEEEEEKSRRPTAAAAALCCAVTEGGALGCVGFRDGAAHTLDTAGAGNWRHSLGATAQANASGQQTKPRAHVGDVNVVKVFPSGSVLLTGAADAALMVWDARSGRHAATLCGGRDAHTRGVLCAAIVERGRNVLSAGRDGNVCLWDVGSQTVIARTAFDSAAQINAISLCGNGGSFDGAAASSSAAAVDPREVGTEGKVLLVASEDCTLRAIDLRTRGATAFHATGAAPFTACCCCCDSSSGQSLFVAGTAEGDVAAWDPRASSAQPLVGPFRKSAAAITEMHLGPSSAACVWTSTADGQLWLQNLASSASAPATPLAELPHAAQHADFEPIMGFGVFNAGREVLFVHRNGRVRSFHPKHVNRSLLKLGLTNDHAIYLTLDGRISMAGLNASNVHKVAKAIHSVAASDY